jgi:hypothetical protein
MYFFPDVVLIRDRQGFGAVSCADLRVNTGTSTFIEDGVVPRDAVVVSYTWRYVNRDGGPDRRFNNNRQLPVLRLGELTLASASGLNIHLNTSNPDHAHSFAECWNSRLPREHESAQSQRTRRAARPETHRTSPNTSAEATGPWKVLGLEPNASMNEITSAYHRLAQMYHPDKVDGLAPEFRELADRRMREINAAYEELRHRR